MATAIAAYLESELSRAQDAALGLFMAVLVIGVLATAIGLLVALFRGGWRLWIAKARFALSSILATFAVSFLSFWNVSTPADEIVVQPVEAEVSTSPTSSSNVGRGEVSEDTEAVQEGRVGLSVNPEAASFEVVSADVGVLELPQRPAEETMANRDGDPSLVDEPEPLVVDDADLSRAVEVAEGLILAESDRLSFLNDPRVLSLLDDANLAASSGASSSNDVSQPSNASANVTGETYPGDLALASIVNGNLSTVPPESSGSSSTPATLVVVPRAAPSESVEVFFTSDPSGAELLIDGVFVGITPFAAKAVPGTDIDYQVVADEPYQDYDLYRAYSGNLTVPDEGTAVSVWLERTTAAEQAAQVTYSNASGRPIPPPGQQITATPSYVINFIANELEVRDTPCPPAPYAPMICAFTSDSRDLVELTINALFEVYLQPAQRTAGWQIDPASGSYIALFTRPEGSYAFSFNSGTISMAFLGN